MAERSSNFVKRLAIDIAGLVLLVGAALFGWIPGPGGIPLLIAGLSLLSINHEWARRWLKKARSGGLSITERIFVDHPIIKLVLDLVGIGLMVLAVFILNNYTRNFYRSLAVSAAFLGIGLFLGNRKRLQRLTQLVRPGK